MVTPVPASSRRYRAPAMAAIRFCSVSATKRRPSRETASPVGPITNAAASVRSAKPLAITVRASSRGAPLDGVASKIRKIVPSCTTLPFPATALTLQEPDEISENPQLTSAKWVYFKEFDPKPYTHLVFL